MNALAGEKSPHARHRSQPARCPPRDRANASSPRPRNLALRHQLTVLQRRTRGRTQLTPADRLLWVWLARSWREWRQGLSLVKPETVVGWSRQRFRTYWARKSRRRSGRPTIDPAIPALIRQISH